MRKAKNFLRRCFAVAYRFTAYLLIWGLPARLWYPTAFLLARIQIRILRLLALMGLYPYRRDVRSWKLRRKLIMARIMDTWLKNLSGARRPFPIPIRRSGPSELDELARSCTSLIFCAPHCLLAETALRGAIEAGFPDLTLIAREPGLANGCLVCGTGQVIPTLNADETVLLKARTVLRRGGSIILIIDRAAGAPLEANMLRLARTSAIRVVFGIPELQDNGEILLQYFVPPLFTSEESIQTSLEALQAERDRILQIAQSPSRTPHIVNPRKRNRSVTTEHLIS